MGELPDRSIRRNELRVAANDSAGKVRDELVTLRKNQSGQAKSVPRQQSQVAELTGKTKKITAHLQESCRDLETQQSMCAQQFLQMRQWRSDVETEMTLRGSRQKK